MKRNQIMKLNHKSSYRNEEKLGEENIFYRTTLIVEICNSWRFDR